MKSPPTDSSTAAACTASHARTVVFRVPVAARVIHEDTETDIAAFECVLEEALDGDGIRVVGCPDGHTLNRPGSPDPHTERRLRVVAADARVAVTAPDGTAPANVTRTASRLLTSRLKRLRGYGIRLLDTPTMWQDSDTTRDEQDLLDLDHPDHDVPGDDVLDDHIEDDDALAHSTVFLGELRIGTADDPRGGEEPGYDREDDPADHAHRRSQPTRAVPRRL